MSSIGPTSGFETIAIDTGGVFLPGGKQYALLLTAEGLTGAGQGGWGYLSGNTYGGGSFVYTNFAIADDWDSFITSTDDLAFSATFTAVPAPLPVAGATAAFAFSRKLRRRIKETRALGNR